MRAAMRRTLLADSLSLFALTTVAVVVLAAASSCSATNETEDASSGTSTGSGSGAGGEVFPTCDVCEANTYVPCNDDGTEGTPIECPEQCANGVGCVVCQPGELTCVGNEVHECSDDGQSIGDVVETCDVGAGMTCHDGQCKDACVVAAEQPSNVGCEFWAVDLDQQDSFNDPASAAWGIALSNTTEAPANVTIEINEAPVGEAPAPKAIQQLTVNPGELHAIALPTRELDCGTAPNQYASPGTCLSSNAYRITSSAPIVVYQFNVFENAYSNDASLLLPTNALGQVYRVINWPAGHPAPVPPLANIVDRSYVTVVGVTDNTQVTVRPSYRIRGNPPIAATNAGEDIVVTLGPFDVLNLETDDSSLNELTSNPWATDLTGTVVEANKPVAVFTGVESTQAPLSVEVPTYPGWDEQNTCCLDHLEDQMMPVQSIGKDYVITRSPIRSTSGFREADVIRFLGVAEAATVTTSLPAPFDSFTLAPGEVKTTWTQFDFTVSADKPILIGQITISNQYVDGPYIGDPDLTMFPPVDQYRTEYLILTPGSWNQNWVVIAAEVGSKVTIDGAEPTNCVVEAAGTLLGIDYEARRCPLAEGVHRLSGDKPYGIVAYGYGSAGSYAFPGGADVKPIYEAPPIPK